MLEPAGVVGLLVNLALYLAGVAMEALNPHRFFRLGLMIQVKKLSMRKIYHVSHILKELEQESTLIIREKTNIFHGVQVLVRALLVVQLVQFGLEAQREALVKHAQVVVALNIVIHTVLHDVHLLLQIGVIDH